MNMVVVQESFIYGMIFKFHTIFTCHKILLSYFPPIFVNAKTILTSASTFNHSSCQHPLRCLFENHALKI